MTEQTDTRQLFLRDAEIQIEKIRRSVYAQVPAQLLLTDAIQAVSSLKQLAGDSSADSLRLVADRLETVLHRYSTAQTTPSPIESETVDLAVDWLDQLAILYAEQLPEPKFLITELLYAFDLVERSQVAELESKAASPVDPFLEDPEFEVGKHPVSARQDPFMEDPGFGLEFDLLQRTISFVVEMEKIGIDPFCDDPAIENRDAEDSEASVFSGSSAPLYDFFADDPPPVDDPDDPEGS